MTATIWSLVTIWLYPHLIGVARIGILYFSVGGILIKRKSRGCSGLFEIHILGSEVLLGIDSAAWQTIKIRNRHNFLLSQIVSNVCGRRQSTNGTSRRSSQATVDPASSFQTPVSEIGTRAYIWETLSPTSSRKGTKEGRRLSWGILLIFYSLMDDGSLLRAANVVDASWQLDSTIQGLIEWSGEVEL